MSLQIVRTPFAVVTVALLLSLSAGQAPILPDYRLGADDGIAITVRQAPELNVTVRVAADGTISLPLIGTIAAAQLTITELDLAIEARLKERFIREPDVTVAVTDARSHGVSVVGAVNKPGVHQVPPAGTLLDVIALAGGVTPDAGDTILITRAGDPAPIAVKLTEVLSATAANSRINPGDVVNVQTAGLVYVMGAVKKPGAFAIRGNAGVTVLRALAYGEGTTSLAAQRDAIVLRVGADGSRREIAVDLEKILRGRTADLVLQPQDVLFVPVSGARSASRATLDFLARLLTRGLIP
jgi:polysaccharide export outer membrane protein